MGEAVGFVDGLDTGKHTTVHQPGSYYKEGVVGMLTNDVSIGDQIDWRRVEEDIVVLTPQLGQCFGQPITQKQLRGIGRDGADGKNIEIVVDLSLHNQAVQVIVLPIEIVGKAFFRGIYKFTEGSFADVHVDGQHPEIAYGHALGEVDGGEGFSTALMHGGEHHHRAAVGRSAHEVDVGTNNSKSLVDVVAVFLLYQDLRHGVDLDGGQAFTHQRANTRLMMPSIERHLPKEGERKHCEVGTSTDGGVHRFQQIKQSSRKY